MKKLAVLACLLIACGGKSAPKDTTTKTTTKTTATKSDPKAKGDKPAGPQELYDRLGGQRAIVAVVEDFVGRVAADGRIKFRFFNTDIPKL